MYWFRSIRDCLHAKGLSWLTHYRTSAAPEDVAGGSVKVKRRPMKNLLAKGMNNVLFGTNVPWGVTRIQVDK